MINPITDWSKIRSRLADVGEGVAGRCDNAARVRQILRARAKGLAAPPPPLVEPASEIEVVEFQLAEETYAVETRYVSEVWPLRELTALPGTPEYVAGITNVRGRIMAVMNPRIFLGLPARGLPDANRVVLLKEGEAEFGVLVDDVAGVRRLARSSLLPDLPTLTGLRRAYLLGIGPESLVVLDGARILQDPRLHVDQRRSPYDSQEKLHPPCP